MKFKIRRKLAKILANFLLITALLKLVKVMLSVYFSIKVSLSSSNLLALESEGLKSLDLISEIF